MKVKLTLNRPGGPSSDIVVTTDSTATIADVARAIRIADPVPTGVVSSGTLTLGVVSTAGAVSRVIASELAIGDARLGSGGIIRVVDEVASAATSKTSAPAVIVTVVAGPDKGKVFPLQPGVRYLGRSHESDVLLTDPLVSTQHARLDVSAGAIRVVDLNSANGILQDGALVTRADAEDGQSLTFGDSELRFEIASTSSLSGGGDSVLVEFNRAPVVVGRYAGSEYTAPALPGEQASQAFPWLMMVAPLLLGVGLFAFTHSAQSLLFVALSPVLMLANYFSNRANRRRKQRLDIQKFTARLGTLSDTLDDERVIERDARLAEYPATADIISASGTLGTAVWSRRPEHWSFLSLRLGLGTLPTRNSVKVAGEDSALPEYLDKLNTVINAHAEIDGVPIPENLYGSGALGIAGSLALAFGVARSLLIQLAGLHSPTELIATAIIDGPSTAEFEWIKWLPHAAAASSPLSGIHLANNSASGTALMSALEEIVEQRTGEADHAARGAMDVTASAIDAGANVGRDATSVDPPASPLPAIIVLVTDDAAVERARLIQLAENGAAAGVFVVWVASGVDRLPAACRTYVDVSAADTGTAGYVRLGVAHATIALETIDAPGAMSFAKALAPVIDSSALTVDSSDLPRSISLLTLLGPSIAESADSVLERWQQNDSIADRSGAPVGRSRRPGRLRAIVGQSGADSMHLDLRGQGPHALVGGTTGSGKSEFLQAWVLGMAAEYSPDRVTFMFVDYKGGSAFAECVNLPHTVGLVTDLSPHLVRRALTSLRAELIYREHLLNRKKAKDLIELERRGDPECPPALVLVIDEFAALVNEVPEFVDGVVDIAQRGRSLGIHLIMATQRPAGVIKENLRANTNLRVALRMADADDSVDVVGDKSASAFDPTIPGRAIAKTGPGRLTSFQSGYAGGWTTATAAPPAVEIAELRFGSDVVWEPPEQADRSDSDTDQGPTDQARLVSNLTAASRKARIPVPRRPWLDELARAFDLTKLTQRSDANLLLGIADLPARQQQHEVYFNPDVDGSIAIFGTGGSGKSVVLRTLAAAAGVTPRGGPVDVYGLDFATGSLRMLEALPHVGSIVSGDDPERVIRLLRLLKEQLDSRAQRYAEVNAGSISDYRRINSQPDEPRLLLLIDGFPSFRQEFETTSGRSQWFGVVQQLIAEGRQLGIHVALTADRASSIPSTITSSVQRRVVLRLAEDSAYSLLDVPTDVLSSKSPPGRAIVDDLETQIAIIGGVADVVEQARATAALGDAMRRAGRLDVPPIGTLPREYDQAELPAEIDGKPVLGLSDYDLGPVPFDAMGAFLLAGPPSSGRSTGLFGLTRSVLRAFPKARTFYIGMARSSMRTEVKWTGVATTVEEASELAKELLPALGTSKEKILLVVESLNDFLSTPADAPLVELFKAIKRSDHLVIAEAETGSWGSSWPLLAEIKNSRTGFVLQPESIDGELLLKTPLPRSSRSDFPEGRGYFVARGRAVRVQLPLS
jgi:S-DNA-T family DNA segregation ATPase FtsK/SpoIIIE